MSTRRHARMLAASQRDLFGDRVRAAPRTMMHVADAGMFPDGKNAIHFHCPTCGFDEGWTYQTESTSAAKRGRPCPKCNAAADQEKPI